MQVADIRTVSTRNRANGVLEARHWPWGAVMASLVRQYPVTRVVGEGLATAQTPDHPVQSRTGGVTLALTPITSLLTSIAKSQVPYGGASMHRVLALSLCGVYLSGCAAAAILPVIGAEVAATDALHSGMQPELELSGSVLIQSDWENSFPDSTFSWSGNSEWICARTSFGQASCIEASEEQPDPSAIYRCTMGSGSFLGSTIQGNQMRQYCRHS